MLISHNKKLINCTFNKIDFKKINLLLKYLECDNYSVFTEKNNKYVFKSYANMGESINVNLSDDYRIIIFDGKVETCNIDNEINILMGNSLKFFVEIDYMENEMTFIINSQLLNLDVTKVKTVLNEGNS